MKTCFITIVLLFLPMRVLFAGALSDAANGGIGEEPRRLYRQAVDKCASSKDDPEACLTLLSSLPEDYEDAQYYTAFGYRNKAVIAMRAGLPAADAIDALDRSYQSFAKYGSANKRYSENSRQRAVEAGGLLLSLLQKDAMEKISFVDKYIDSPKDQNQEPQNVFFKAWTAFQRAETETIRFKRVQDQLAKAYRVKPGPGSSSLSTAFEVLEKKYKKEIVDSGYENKMVEALSHDQEIAVKLKNRKTDDNVPDKEQYLACVRESKNGCKAQYDYGTPDYSVCAYRAQDWCSHAYGNR